MSRRKTPTASRKSVRPQVAYAELRDPAPPAPEPPPLPWPVAIAELIDPDDVAPGDPDAPCPPPGPAPAGNARSMRSPAGEFALVYLQGTRLVVRAGVVGRRGRWRAVDYPTRAAASHAYANECSRLATEGYVDVTG
jgi:hypothetical protein